MDAVKFLKERNRMCKLHEHCKGCQLERGRCGLSVSMSDEECEKLVAAVEQWSKKHPRKTRQSVFLEQYPETILDAFGVVQLCPMCVSATYRDSDGECKDPEERCIDCRREFWMQEVE